MITHTDQYVHRLQNKGCINYIQTSSMHMGTRINFLFVNVYEFEKNVHTAELEEDWFCLLYT